MHMGVCAHMYICMCVHVCAYLQMHILPLLMYILHFLFYELVLLQFRREKGRAVEMQKEHGSLSAKNIAIRIISLFRRQRKNIINILKTFEKSLYGT